MLAARPAAAITSRWRLDVHGRSRTGSRELSGQTLAHALAGWVRTEGATMALTDMLIDLLADEDGQPRRITLERIVD